MVHRKRRKEETMIYKTLHRKLKIVHRSTTTRGGTFVIKIFRNKLSRIYNKYEHMYNRIEMI